MDFIPRKIEPATINGGQRFTARDGVTAGAINAPIEAALYTQKLTDNPVDTSDIAIGDVPTITIVEGANGPYFKFSGFMSISSVTITDIVNAIAEHNLDEDAHPDIRALIESAGSSITVDDALSEYSTNPVQNKVIYTELQKKQDKLVRGENLDDAPIQGSTKPVTSGGVYEYINGIANTLNETKQDKLIAGENITIDEDGTISATGGSGTVEGIVEATPNTVAMRDSEGKLHGNNINITGNPASDMEPTTLINAETLEWYAQKKITGDPYKALYGFDDNGNPRAYSVSEDSLSGFTDRIPTDYAVSMALSAMDEKYASKEELDAKQDKLTFDPIPYESSPNPVESQGVYSAIATCFSDSQNYTDYKVQEALNSGGNVDVSNKLDKDTSTTDLAQAYVKNADGTQTMVDLCIGLKSDSIVIRDSRGQITVDDATNPTDAVPKYYVDDKIGEIETALDSIIAEQEAIIAIQKALIGGVS